MKKIKSVTIGLMLIFSILIAMPVTLADADNTEFEILPNSTDVKNGTQVTFSLYVTGQTDQAYDTIGMDIIQFNASCMQFVGTGVTQGDLFSNSVVWIDGDVDNTGGYINDSVWGNQFDVTNNDGYYCNMTFNTTAVGAGWVNIVDMTVALTPDGGGDVQELDWLVTSNGTVDIHEYIPNPPASFTATRHDSQQIDLSWTKGTHADKTYIEWNSTSTWAFGEGTALGYNDTGTSTTHSGLSEGTRYYYQAWSWNDTDNEWSSTYSSDDAWTNNIPDFGTPSPNNNTGNQETSLTWGISITDKDADTFNWTIECSNGQSSSANDANNGTKQLSISGLSYSTQYTVWVNATDGMDWERQWYLFTTRDQITVNPPTGFTATTFNTTQINLTWSLGASSDKVYIERYSSPDWSRGTGTEIYNNSGTSYEDSGRDAHTHYYYQAWGWNDTDSSYSSTNSSDDNTTLNTAPSSPSGEVPTDGDDYTNIYDIYMNVTVSDADAIDDGSLTATFYWANHTSITSVSSLADGATASVYLPDYIEPDWLDHSTLYEWYVNVTDSYDTTQSSVYNFTTEHRTDLNHDRGVDGSDVSLLVSHYGETLTSGSEPWDIGPGQGDGIVNALDVSVLVTFYGSSF
jgi:hypothetical protein